MTASIHYAVTGEDGRKAAERGALLGPLSILARQRKTWSPLLLGGVLWRAVTNVWRHRKILGVLELPEYAEIARSDPRFAFKYLTHGYLARRFTVAERAACFTHHYTRLRDSLPQWFLLRILRRDASLVSLEEGGTHYNITFGFSRTHDKEGELSLNLEVDGETVFILSFTIVPGKVVGSEDEDVLLVTRIQGVKGCYKEIQRATRSMRDVASGALLVAALQGVGEALGVRTMGSISAADQNSYCQEFDRSFRTAYDDFFAELGVEKNASDIYLTPIPIPEKPLALIKQGHKLRTREKREFKRRIAERAAETLRDSCRGKRREVRKVRMATMVEAV